MAVDRSAGDREHNTTACLDEQATIIEVASLNIHVAGSKDSMKAMPWRPMIDSYRPGVNTFIEMKTCEQSTPG